MRPKPRYQPGDKIGGRYQVHQALMGGMGEVYLCLDLEEMIPLALKTFQQRYLTNPKLRAAFENEVATWVALEKHPNIVRCFYMDILDNQPFMFLEWIASDESRGTDLRSWLRRGPLDLRLALDFTIDICRGLIHAQEKQPGIVHRDLKPDNILVAQGRLAKITDFGLAQIVQKAELNITADTEDDTEQRQSLLGQGGIVGTPPYMAPEQWQGEPLDVRTDIYAIGCILYELLTGCWPFQATSFGGFRHQHLTADIPKLPEGQSCFSVLDTLLARCLAKRREERFTTVDDLLQQLMITYQQQFAEMPRVIFFSDPFITAVGYQQQFSESLETNPILKFRAEDYSNRGVAYNNLQHYDEALADFDRAIKLDPNLALAYLNRGSTYRNLHRYGEALADFDRAIKLDPNDARAFSNRGNVYDGLHRYDEALADHNQAIRLDPNLMEAYNNRAHTYADLNRYEEALADYDRAIKIDPTLAIAWYNKGIILYKLSQPEEALAAYDQALTLDPALVEAWSEKVVALWDVGRREEALAVSDRVLALAPTNVSTWSSRSNALRVLGRPEEALAALDQALALDSTYAPAWSNKGDVLYELDQLKEARDCIERALEIDNGLPEVWLCKGSIFSKEGDKTQALACYDKALEINPKLAMAWSNKGAVLADWDRTIEALECYSKALNINPNLALAWSNKGNAL